MAAEHRGASTTTAKARRAKAAEAGAGISVSDSLGLSQYEDALMDSAHRERQRQWTRVTSQIDDALASARSLLLPGSVAGSDEAQLAAMRIQAVGRGGVQRGKRRAERVASVQAAWRGARARSALALSTNADGSPRFPTGLAMPVIGLPSG